MTHICVGNLTIIASDNGLSPGRRQAIIWTNAGILFIWPSGTNFGEILIEIHFFFIQENAFESVVCETAAILFRPQCVNASSKQIKSCRVEIQPLNPGCLPTWQMKWNQFNSRVWMPSFNALSWSCAKYFINLLVQTWNQSTTYQSKQLESNLQFKMQN